MQCSMIEIGERIAELRKKRNLTQGELAKILNVSREVVAKWENGTRDLKIEHAVALADFFNITCDEIILGLPSQNVEINKATGLSSEAIEALRYYATDIFSDLVRDKSPVEALNLLFTVYDEAEIIDGVPEMNFFWHLRKYFFTTKEELEIGLLSMNYIPSDGSYEIITEEDLEEILMRRIEKRLRYYRKITQDRLEAEKLKELEREERKQKRAVSSEVGNGDAE